MTYTIVPRLLMQKGLEPRNGETRDAFIRWAYYGIQHSASMESISLQEGDMLPDAGYTSYRIKVVTEGPDVGGYSKTVHVRAERARGWSGAAI